MPKDEMEPILDKLLSRCASPQSRKLLGQILANERFYYVEPYHGKRLSNQLWTLGQAIWSHSVVEAVYDPFPTLYRVDRIEKLQVLDEHFQVPYSRRFSEGEFRKRVQFMYGGKLETVRFIYKGPSVEAVLDRLSTAEILSEHDGCYEIRAEVFGKGIEMWLRSQGDRVIWKDCPQKTNEQGKGMQ